MGPRADKHDDVYDRQIRLWGADAQVRVVCCDDWHVIQNIHKKCFVVIDLPTPCLCNTHVAPTLHLSFNF